MDLQCCTYKSSIVCIRSSYSAISFLFRINDSWSIKMCKFLVYSEFICHLYTSNTNGISMLPTTNLFMSNSYLLLLSVFNLYKEETRIFRSNTTHNTGNIVIKIIQYLSIANIMKLCECLWQAELL